MHQRLVNVLCETTKFYLSYCSFYFYVANPNSYYFLIVGYHSKIHSNLHILQSFHLFNKTQSYNEIDSDRHLIDRMKSWCGFDYKITKTSEIVTSKFGIDLHFLLWLQLSRQDHYGWFPILI